jgi:hypothetical protein
MKSIALCLVSFIIYLFLLIATNKIERLRSVRRSFTPIFISIALVPVYLLLYFTTPISLGIFPSEFLSENLTIDILNGLFLYICLCVGFVDFLIGAAITPFSANILLEIYKSRDQGLSESDLKTTYCLDSFDKSLMSKRILLLNRIGFIRELPEGYFVTKEAMIWAWIIQNLRRFAS